MSNLQGEDNSNKNNNNENKDKNDFKIGSNKSDTKMGWCMFQCAKIQATQLKQGSKFATLMNKIILDTGSTLPATFINPDLVTNIHKLKYPLVMNTK